MKTFSDYGIIGIKNALGGQQRVLCPECSHTRQNKPDEKCLSVDVDKKTWYCHHCAWNGGIGIDKQEYWHNVESYTSIDYKPIINNDSELIAYFKTRGISEHVVKRNNISQYKDWILFPSYINDDCVNVKYRGIKEKKFMQSKDGYKSFYKLNDIIDAKYAIICEGEIDALSFEQAGILNAVSVPEGAINPDAKNITQKLKFIDNTIKYFDNIDEIYIATDNDASGRRLADELSRRFGRERCRIVKFPDGCKDANDVLLKYGTSELIKIIANAEMYPIENVQLSSTFTDSLIDIWHNGFQTGANTNTFEKFDSHFTFHAGQLTVVTGIPSHGKSNFIDQIIIELAKNAGWKSAVFSPENPSTEIWLIRLLEILTKRPFYSGFNRLNPDDIITANKYINEYIFSILPEDNFQLDNVLATAKMLIRRYGINMLVIDPFNNIESSISRNESETSYIAKVLVKLRNFARKTGIHLILIAHPKKMNKINGSDYNFEIPVLYDISGSANFYNVADNGLTVYRRFDESDASKSNTEIYIQKVKSKYIGKLGRIDFSYDINTQSYTEMNVALY